MSYNGCPFTPIITSNFSWLNQGSATMNAFNTTNGTLQRFSTPGSTAANNQIMYYQTPPSTPYSIIANMNVHPDVTPNYMQYCIGWSDGTKFLTGGVINQKYTDTPAGPCVTCFEFTNYSTYGSTALSYVNSASLSLNNIWLKLRDNGTNLIFYNSADGLNWYQIYSQARTSYLSNPNHVGFIINTSVGSTTQIDIDFNSWQIIPF